MGNESHHRNVDGRYPAFDFVVASDVAAFVYGSDAMESLVDSLLHLTSRGQGAQVLMSFKRRDASVEGSFWKKIKDSFEIVEELPRSCIHSDFRDDESIGIVRMQKPKL